MFCSRRLLFAIVMVLVQGRLQCASEPFIFVHVPKTGGQTVASLIDSHFDRKKVFPGYFYFNLDDSKKKNLTNFDLIRGHFFYSQLCHLHGKKITFVREPVKRTISEHRFWSRYNRSPGTNALVRLHYLPPGDPLYMMSNHQCLFLSSYDPRDPTITIEQHLESAIKNLNEEFWFVGITEELDDGVRALFSMMGWKDPGVIPRRNATKPTSETFSDALLEEIRQRNWADTKLYECAKALYTTRFSKFLPPSQKVPKAKKRVQSRPSARKTDDGPHDEVHIHEESWSESAPCIGECLPIEVPDEDKRPDERAR